MIKIVRSEKSWIESKAVDQLDQVAKLGGIDMAVGLPDLHVGKTPVGAAYMTKSVIYPHIVGNDIGCGMALFETGMKRTKFKTDKAVKKLERLADSNEIDLSDLNIAKDFPFREKLGSIGSGNHFAEFQEVDSVYDAKELEKIRMDKGEVYLLVHSGSRSYGEDILSRYLQNHSCKDGISVASEVFSNYMKEYESALEFARINREIIASRILGCVNAKSQRKLLDSVHNGISEKDVDGSKVYIHRKGASPSDVGCVVVAGSRGTSSYVVKPKENLFEYCFSVSHGAGRKWNRGGCKEKLENAYSKKHVRGNSLETNLIYREKSVVYEEAPQAYKNIDRVIEDMLEAGMITLVASLKPLITYKV